ncbi:DUF418 domain-containing protein [Qipengyuania zhejiangensis]|uniref:DUF418 domain-containing protein n=1 Tax=Qipengyuania zhejiangensis TaxID=3077782 RepID=UPI002D77BDE8|nr:DUF418 domain-containing protein [Qipengyuania sp. Z2]
MDSVGATISDSEDDRVARPVSASDSPRIASLDFIRGIAVMGILAANIVAFGQPMTAYMFPDAFTVPHSDAEDWMWVAQFVLIDSKMRGLFTLLFGAGMYLFLEGAWAKGRTNWLQVRRLLWLGLFGLVHFFFIWRGDILFHYACAGMIALLFVGLSRRKQLVIGLLGYVGGALLYTGFVGFLPVVSDTEFGEKPGMVQLAKDLEEGKQADLADGVLETRLISEGRYGDWVGHNFSDHGTDVPTTVLMFLFETLPLMLVGMAAYRYGLFSGGIDARRQRQWGWSMLVLGTALTLPIALLAKSMGLTYYGTLAAMVGWSFLPRLLAILGLLALLALWGNSVRGALAERVSAAGRAAFTNYLGTSVLMMLVFHGWAGGLFGELGRSELYLVTVSAWGVMLLWSKPWLERFRYGPLEWLWRCLTYGRVFPLRR